MAFLLHGASLSAQISLLMMGLAALYLAPPASGQILLVPLTGPGRAHVVAWAIDHGARLVAAGPFAGSMVVVGERNRLALPLLRRGVLALSAKATGCGAPGAVPA